MADAINPNQKPHYTPIQKNIGVTPAEKYLSKLCHKNFLSLWSYPGVFRDQGKPEANKGDGKEVCDLLVVCGEHIIIFSDKDCDIRPKGNDLVVPWKRWFRRAIADSASQTWGAKRWISEHPQRLYLDRKCTLPLPIDLPDIKKAKFHLVVVAHGISPLVAEHFGGTGSLMINSALKGIAQHDAPFYIGDVDPAKSFVHVFDDYSLRIVMDTRDTISDFVDYLQKRERLLRGPIKILAPGEEDLLPFYLKNLTADGEHDFVFPTSGKEPLTLIALEEGHWEDFQDHPQRRAQLHQNEISYMWDRLIEKFNYYALRGEQHFITSGGIKDSDKILQFMAREPRVKRRAFAQMLDKMLQSTKANHQRINLIVPLKKGDPYYFFLLFPFFISSSIPYEHYREARRNFLVNCLGVVRLLHPEAEDIIGIATESGLDTKPRSEDAIYLDGRHWTDELAKQAKEFQDQENILKTARPMKFTISEFPDVPLEKKIKNPRNKKCPCGSGKKYKHCCLNK